MYKYELYEIDTFMYKEKLVAKSNNLPKLREYALGKYSSNNDPQYDKEVDVYGQKKNLYFYDNRNGKYHGSGYEPHGLIKLAAAKNEDYIIIE